MNTKMVYLMLAIVGAIVPYVFFIQHFGAAGLARIAGRQACLKGTV